MIPHPASGVKRLRIYASLTAPWGVYVPGRIEPAYFDTWDDAAEFVWCLLEMSN